MLPINQKCCQNILLPWDWGWTGLPSAQVSITKKIIYEKGTTFNKQQISFFSQWSKFQCCLKTPQYLSYCKLVIFCKFLRKVHSLEKKIHHFKQKITYITVVIFKCRRLPLICYVANKYKLLCHGSKGAHFLPLWSSINSHFSNHMTAKFVIRYLLAQRVI